MSTPSRLQARASGGLRIQATRCECMYYRSVSAHSQWGSAGGPVQVLEDQRRNRKVRMVPAPCARVATPSASMSQKDIYEALPRMP